MKKPLEELKFACDCLIRCVLITLRPPYMANKIERYYILSSAKLCAKHKKILGAPLQ